MANKTYVNEEVGSAIVWTDDTTGGDETLDLGGLAVDGVRVGDRHDFGAAARSEWYEWRFVVDGFTTNPDIGCEIELYWATSDGTNADGKVPTTDGAGDEDELPNMRYLGSAVAADDWETPIVASGIFRFTQRYGQPVVFNNTTSILESSSESHKVIITPIPPEVQ